ncbi:hypothetical protein SALBM311S_01622 [Streptomyces alboniger]
MRKALRWLLALAVLIGTLSTAGAATAAEPEATGREQAPPRSRTSRTGCSPYRG